MTLPNETKIQFMNGFNAMDRHSETCSQCLRYIKDGSGDLCPQGKDIIAKHLYMANTQKLNVYDPV